MIFLGGGGAFLLIYFYLEMSIVGRIMERSVIIQTLGVDLCSGCQQLLRHIIVAPVARLMQGGPTGKIFYIHISSFADELLDAAHLPPDGCPVQPSLSSFVSFIHFVFGFRCRVWCSLLTHAGL